MAGSRQTRARAALVVLALAAAGCASTSVANDGEDERSPRFWFHHKCYNRITFALYFGTPDNLEGRMTGPFSARQRADVLLSEFDARVGRGHVQEGTATNIDGLLREGVYGPVQRILFIPRDADKAAYIMFLKNTPDGCKLDDLEFR